MANVNLKVTHTVLSESVREYAQKNIDKLQKYLRPENKVHLELGAESKNRDGLRYRAEITIMPKSEVYADAYGHDLFEAIDLLMPKVKEQLMKMKDKRVSERRRDGAKRTGKI
ncbi:MAG: Ribosomal subunit interface protein [Candidatus Doudnabacteria bacterium]|nr:Ribosomal subunit interface protein [Candidatus Doudnabacteria bacterium]